MGANGSLGTVNLKDHSFDKIKDLILSVVGHAYDSLYEDHWEDLFYKVCEANDIQELSWLFQSKVVGFVEPSAGIEIEGQLVCYWARASVPCVVRDHVLRLCVCLPLAQGFNLPTNLMGQIA